MTTDIETFRNLLSDPSAEKRREAAEQLCRRGEEACPAAVQLARATADEDEQVQQWATAALEELGPPEVKWIDDLKQILAEPEADPAYWSATLIGRLEAQGATAVGTLIEALQSHPAANVRQRAAWALGQVGTEAGESAEALTDAAKSDDKRLARLARGALEKIQRG